MQFAPPCHKDNRNYLGFVSLYFYDPVSCISISLYDHGHTTFYNIKLFLHLKAYLHIKDKKSVNHIMLSKFVKKIKIALQKLLVNHF